MGIPAPGKDSLCIKMGPRSLRTFVVIRASLQYIKTQYHDRLTFIMEMSTSGKIILIYPPVDSLQTGPVIWSFDVFFVIDLKIHWTNSQVAGDLRCHDSHVISLVLICCPKMKYISCRIWNVRNNCCWAGSLDFKQTRHPRMPHFYAGSLWSKDDLCRSGIGMALLGISCGYSLE